MIPTHHHLLHLRKKPRDDDKHLGLSSFFTIEEIKVENNNKPRGLLLFFATEEKKTKDDDELGSLLSFSVAKEKKNQGQRQAEISGKV